MVSIEHERDEITYYLLEACPEMDLTKKDAIHGNTPLHIATMKEDVGVV